MLSRGVVHIFLTIEDSKIEFVDKNLLIKFINEYVVNYFKKKYLYEYLQRNYNFLTNDDKNKIIQSTPRCLEFEIIIDELNLLSVLNSSFDIQGILNFRVKESKKYVNMIIDILVEEIIIDNEYLGLMNLIKHIISNSDENKSINIIFLTNGNILWNFENKKGSVGANRNFFNRETLNEEFLIESILREKPQKAIIHNINYARSRDFIKTLNNIFNDNFIVCTGCVLCNNIYS